MLSLSRARAARTLVSFDRSREPIAHPRTDGLVHELAQIDREHVEGHDVGHELVPVVNMLIQSG